MSWQSVVRHGGHVPRHMRTTWVPAFAAECSSGVHVTNQWFTVCHAYNPIDVGHIVFDCPLYAPERERWPDLFAGPPSLHAFFQQPAIALAQFAAACRRRGRQANGLPP